MQELIQTAYTMIMTYGPKLVLALVVLIVGLWLIKKVVGGLNANLTAKADATLGKFGSSVVSVILKAVLLISVALMVGIETTSLIAVLGAAGLAIGFALQGSLANFAGVVLILLFKPFKAGDLIEAPGYIGTVREVQISNTILTTADNRIVVIPNGALSSNSMVNINQESTRRVELTFGIGYDDDIDIAKTTINNVIAKDERVLKDIDPLVVLSELADSSVNFTVRVWVNTPDYWGVYFAMHEQVKKEFDANGISIPFPQQDVHMHQAA